MDKARTNLPAKPQPAAAAATASKAVRGGGSAPGIPLKKERSFNKSVDSGTSIPSTRKSPESSATTVGKKSQYSSDREQGPSSRVVGSPSAEDTGVVSRVDISGEVTEIFLEKLSDKNWKVRDEALDRIATIVTKARYITPNLGELPAALCLRFQDSNRNLAANAFLLCQNLAGALGPHCKQYIRSFLPSMLSGLADSKVS